MAEYTQAWILSNKNNDYFSFGSLTLDALAQGISMTKVSEMSGYNPGLCPLCGQKMEMGISKELGGWICYLRCMDITCRVAIIGYGNLPDEAFTKVVQIWQLKSEEILLPTRVRDSIGFLLGLLKEAESLMEPDPAYHKMIEAHANTLRDYLKATKSPVSSMKIFSGSTT